MQTLSLTNGTDTATASIFEAGLLYTPNGNDRINSLQSEDRLTGTSAATDTLNVTIGNTNDNGNTMITPTMTSIETANVVMSHNDGTGLDLQDAAGLSTVNVTRIANGGSDIQNMQGTVTTLSAADTQEVTNVSFTYLNSELAGTNTVGVTLSNVNAATLTVGAEAVQSEQIETVNLTSAVASTANTVDLQSDGLVTTGQRLNIIATSSFRAGSDTDGDGNIIEENNGFSADTVAGLNNITITGAGNVTLGSVTTPSTNADTVAEQAFTLDGSAATGAIAVNITNAAALGDNLTATSMFTTGSGNDTVVSQTINNGAGNNLLGDVATGAGNDSVTIRANVITDQNNNHFASIDTGEGDDTVTVTGSITGGVAGGAAITTGAGNDTMTLGVANTVGGGVANLGEEASINMGEGNDTLTMTATTAGDTGTGLDADFLGSSIDMGAGDDTVTFDLTGKADQGLLIGGTLAGGEGANTLTITGNASVANVANFDPTPDADSVTGFATLNAISEQSYNAAIVAAVNAIQPGMITANDNDVSAVTSNTADYTVDASEFTGLTAINFTNQAGVTTPLAVEGTTANRFEGDTAAYTVNNYEAQTITVNTVEALTGAAVNRVTAIAATYDAATNVAADATLNIANANIATGATDSATSAATVVIAGEGDVAIDDTSVAGTGVVDDIEVLNLTVNGAASRTVAFDAVQADFETTMTMGGDTTGTITLTNVEATTFTSTIAGNVNATVLTSENKTITTGAGNDVMNLLADVVNVSDTINLGTGTDRIIINDDIRGTGADADENFDNISGVEELEVRGNGGATLDVTLDDDAFTTGISRVVLAQDAGAVDANVDLDIGVDFNRALRIDVAQGSTLNIDNDANVNTTVNVNGLLTTGTGTANLTFADAGTGTVALNITVDDTAQTINDAGGNIVIVNQDNTAEIDSITLLDSNRVSATNITPAGNQLVAGEDQTGAITLTLGAAWAQAGDTVTVNASDINDDDRTDGGVLTNTDNQTVTINAAAANYSVNITGSQMVDTITGTNRADTIDGQAGNDVITGGDGVDTLTGGAGADTFVYTSFTNSNSDSTDTITDFVSGTDKVSVSLTAIAGEVVNLGRFASVTTSGAGDDSLGGTSTVGSKVVGDAYYSSTGKLAIDVDGNGDITSGADIVVNSATAVAAGDINYTVTGTGGADTIRAGQGADAINGGLGDDIIVMVGALTATDVNNYAAAGNIGAITANAEVQKVVNYTELTTVRTATEVNTGDTLDGQGGTDTLHVFGTTDLTLINAGAALNVETLVVHSNITMTDVQVAAMAAGSIILNGNVAHTITVTDTGAAGGATVADLLAKLTVVGSGANTSVTIVGTNGSIVATVVAGVLTVTTVNQTTGQPAIGVATNATFDSTAATVITGTTYADAKAQYAVSGSGYTVTDTMANIVTAIGADTVTAVNNVLAAAAASAVTITEVSGGISTVTYTEANVDAYQLANAGNATMTVAQHAKLNAATGTNTVTIATADLTTVTVNAAVENYIIQDDTAGNAVTVTGVTGAQTVTATSGSDAVIVEVSGNFTGNLTGDTADVVSLAAGANIALAGTTAGAAFTGFTGLTLAAGTVTMTEDQFEGFSGTIVGNGTNVVVITNDADGDEAITAKDDIESYTLQKSITTFTLSDVGQSVTAAAGTTTAVASAAGDDALTGTFIGTGATLNITADDGDDFKGATFTAVGTLTTAGTNTVDESNVDGLTAITFDNGTLTLQATGAGTFNLGTKLSVANTGATVLTADTTANAAVTINIASIDADLDTITGEAAAVVTSLNLTADQAHDLTTGTYAITEIDTLTALNAAGDDLTIDSDDFTASNFTTVTGQGTTDLVLGTNADADLSNATITGFDEVVASALSTTTLTIDAAAFASTITTLTGHANTNLAVSGDVTTNTALAISGFDALTLTDATDLVVGGSIGSIASVVGVGGGVTETLTVNMQTAGTFTNSVITLTNASMQVNGTSGADTFVTSAAAVSYTGGNGSDTYAMAAATANIITDFAGGAGGDVFRFDDSDFGNMAGTDTLAFQAGTAAQVATALANANNTNIVVLTDQAYASITAVGAAIAAATEADDIIIGFLNATTNRFELYHETDFSTTGVTGSATLVGVATNIDTLGEVQALIGTNFSVIA